MAKVTFVYEGGDDDFEHGRVIEYTFGKSEIHDGMTWDKMCEHFDFFLKSIGYVYEGNVTIVKDDY